MVGRFLYISECESRLKAIRQRYETSLIYSVQLRNQKMLVGVKYLKFGCGFCERLSLAAFLCERKLHSVSTSHYQYHYKYLQASSKNSIKHLMATKIHVCRLLNTMENFGSLAYTNIIP